MKKTIVIMSMFFVMLLSTSANAIWLLVEEYRFPINPRECDILEKKCFTIIPILREAWVLHPRIIITRFHHRGVYPSTIIYSDKDGEKILTAYMTFDSSDGGGLVAYISNAPLDVEFTMANMVDFLHEKRVTMRDIYTIREFYVNVLGDFERDRWSEDGKDTSQDTYLSWIDR